VNKKYGAYYLKDIDGSAGKGTLKVPSYIKDSTAIDTSVITETTASLIEKAVTAPFTGSNAWMVSPSRSKSGKVLFANDAHINYSQPCVWYEAHLSYPGFSFYGNYLAGFPFAALGHTRAFTWGLTMLLNDDTDFYTEQVKADDKFKVLRDRRWVPVQVKTKSVQVRGEEDKECIVRISDHGPLVQGVMPEWKHITDYAVACSWTHLKFPNNLLEVIYNINHAGNMDDVRQAASQIISPGVNIMYGDSAGNIAWWSAAKIIKRRPDERSFVLMDGRTGSPGQEYYDFSSNPKSENPPEGYIYNANNAPETATGVSIPGYYAPEDRARRITELLNDRDRYSAEDFQRINVDAVSVTAPKIAQNILALLGKRMSNKTPVHNKAYITLLRWNGDHQPGDLAPTIYYRLLYYVLRYAMIDELGEANFNAYLKTHALKTSLAALIDNDKSLWWDDITTTKTKEIRRNIFNRAFDQTINDLVKYLDESVSNWEWGRVHQLEHVHPLGMQKPLNYIFNVGPFPVPGGIETVNESGFYLTSERNFKVNHGPAMRTVIDFANIDNAMSILPTGQSGNVLSNYYRDQSSIYNNGKLRGMKMTRGEIHRKKSGRLLLQPAM
jgi:penicillin G amidase